VWACGFVCWRVALLIKHAKRMRRIILSSVVSLAPPYFSTLSRKQHIFGTVIERKTCVLMFCTLSEAIFILK
jgi:hypothetical protein